MEYIKFTDIAEYLAKNSVEQILHAAITKELMLYEENYFYSDNLDDQIAHLNKITNDKYTIILGDVIKAEIYDIKDNIEKYKILYEDLLSDGESKNVLLNILFYRLTREEKYILNAFSEEGEQYFDDRISVYRKDCVFADCGALDGFTTIEFLLHCPQYKKIYSYEPIKSFYNNCVKNIESVNAKNIILRNVAVYSENTELKFSENVSGSSKADEYGNILVKTVCLDEDITESLDFIKMDIEGSEKLALIGAKKHIKNDNPMLAICVYHLPSDLWEIPFIIKELNDNYTFLLRHYTTSVNETVLYAIPKNEISAGMQIPLRIEVETELACLGLLYGKQKESISRLNKTQKYLMLQLENYKNFYSALEKSNVELKNWNSQIEDGKRYLEQQLLLRDKVIDELKNWNSQIEDGKRYLEQQLLLRNKVIDELKNWNLQIEDGKSYLEQQLLSGDKVIVELKDWINKLDEGKNYLEKILNEKTELVQKYKEISQEQENRIGMMTNEIQKLNYYLKEEISKPWYKKLLGKWKNLQ